MPRMANIPPSLRGKSSSEAAMDLAGSLGGVVSTLGGPGKAVASVAKTAARKAAASKVTKEVGETGKKVFASSSRRIGFPTKWQAELDDARDALSAAKRRRGGGFPAGND